MVKKVAFDMINFNKFTQKNVLSSLGVAFVVFWISFFMYNTLNIWWGYYILYVVGGLILAYWIANMWIIPLIKKIKKK